MSTIIETVRRLIGADEHETTPVQAIWNGTVIAESDRTVGLEGNHYFAAADVEVDYLEPSPRKTICPWKGVASYYDVVVDGVRNPGGAWYYPHPSPLARKIKDHIAFWQGVEVRRAPPACRENADALACRRRGASGRREGLGSYRAKPIS
jgi:uncharacterized protein (DUF427 family)